MMCLYYCHHGNKFIGLLQCHCVIMYCVPQFQNILLANHCKVRAEQCSPAYRNQVSHSWGCTCWRSNPGQNSDNVPTLLASVYNGDEAVRLLVITLQSQRHKLRKEWPTREELCLETCRQDRNTWKLTVNCGVIGSGLLIAGCKAVTRGARSCWG